MEIKFLGNWSSHIKKGVKNTSVIFDRRLVADFGPHTLEAIFEKGIDPKGIDTVLITHMHLDHYMGLAELLWYRGSRKLKDPITVMGPRGIKEATESILKLVNTPDDGAYELNVNYVETGKLDDITAYDGNHIIADNVYRMEFKNCSVVYTGDTAYSENVVRAAEDADFLIHEMTYTDQEAEKAAFWKHSTYSSVMGVMSESHAGILVPTHLTDGTANLLAEKSKKHENIVMPEVDIAL